MFNTIPSNPFPPSSANAGGGGGSYVLPVASAETLGGVKVGNNLTIADGVLSAPAPCTPPAYSTNEFDTGKKWIDNKTIYGKVFDFSSTIVVSNNTWTNTEEDTHGATFINAFGIASSGEVFSVNAGNDNNKLVLMVNAYTSITLKKVIVEYTKTESEG